MKEIIPYYWTSKKPINGLRHFVLINKVNQNSQTSFQLVSVLDLEISLEISKEDLMNKNKWHSGWLDLSKSKSITTNYLEFKSNKKNKNKIKKIFVNDDSPFNIS